MHDSRVRASPRFGRPRSFETRPSRVHLRAPKLRFGFSRAPGRSRYGRRPATPTDGADLGAAALDAISFLSSAAVSSWTSMRAPPRLLPPALPIAESTGVLPRLSLALRSAPCDDQERDHVVPAPARRLVQRRQAARVLRVDVAAGLQQQLQRRDRALLRVLATDRSRACRHRPSPVRPPPSSA